MEGYDGGTPARSDEDDSLHVQGEVEEAQLVAASGSDKDRDDPESVGAGDGGDGGERGEAWTGGQQHSENSVPVGDPLVRLQPAVLGLLGTEAEQLPEDWQREVVIAVGDSGRCVVVAADNCVWVKKTDGESQWVERSNVLPSGGMISAVSVIMSVDKDAGLIAVGSTSGWLVFLTLLGQQVAKCRLHSDRVCSLKSRSCSFRGLETHDCSEDLLAVCGGNFVVRVDGLQISALFRCVFTPVPPPELVPSRCRVSSCAFLLDAVAVGTAPSTLHSILQRRESSDLSSILVVAAGAAPALSLLRLVEDSTDGGSGTVDRLVNAVGSLAKSWLWGSTPKAVASPTSSEQLRPATTCQPSRLFQDGDRQCCGCIADPSGSGLVAVSDSLGRVLLVETIPQLVVVRMWKGYREATCVWDSSGFLLIHAPRKQLLEAWSMIHGPRLWAYTVPLGTMLLQGCQPAGGSVGQRYGKGPGTFLLMPTGELVSVIATRTGPRLVSALRPSN